MNDSIPAEALYLGDTVWLTAGDTGRLMYVTSTANQHCVSLSDHPHDGGQIIVGREDVDLKLVRRGNGFRYQYDLEMMPFTDVGHEATFWSRLGLLEQVPNDSDGFFVWSIEDAIKALKAELVDVCVTSSWGGLLEISSLTCWRLAVERDMSDIRRRSLYNLMALQPA